MPAAVNHNPFWWQWIAANSLAELLGLGGVAVAGIVIATYLGEPQGLLPSLGVAALFVLLGAGEGLVVGMAQAIVLRRRLPELRGWVRATVAGAVVAWVVGMAPSTIMNIVSPDTSAGPPPQISESVRLLLAAGLGLATGPLLAFFQWRRLRRYVMRHAAWWLIANALAWALAMPVIFAGVHLTAALESPRIIVLGAGLSLLAAGAIAGAVHGYVLVRLLAIENGSRP